ncbi:bifunctional 2-C-methyl-D-erythritol 4-phosphate cytidylyltransferase/2-C-methyl-D-erythritol 2,4-cyclodiphosphate synthase [Roseibium hamelinense]|nr:bifunctional 2-C-methyl-D-erythritol 4-phosphate cytidylyltransferase/2-C-methyl-D-erythritol 2,4-cyclodiphosphate synthase [Roseibium hamelinense]MTI45757.1 bifunctional 2-C-methyl-D-erythritol 4-phosphate cytidylyltransferase/2-C-methyl-D-erythritol 2,4-cyclodiphosphate synthase [Roseibium hamelinense]
MTGQIAALIVAAGRGSRFGATASEAPKQYQLLSGRPVLSHTLDAFLRHPRIGTVATVIAPNDLAHYEAAIAALTAPARKLAQPVHGGESRQVSVHNGLKALEIARPNLVLIHDGARPLVTSEVIDDLIGTLQSGAQAGLAAVPVFDTLKRRPEHGGPLETVDRTGLHAAQTPQGFRFSSILEAHEEALSHGLHHFTDDTSLAEWRGLTVQLSAGDPENIKITTREDLDRAERIMKMSKPDHEPAPLSRLDDVRMGTGYDVHALEPGDGIMLCGVKIPFDKRLKGHSDADVAQHAVTDAILGAIADGDIGMHFPPSDPQWKGASSDQFLKDAIRRVRQLGGQIAHIDVTIVCEAPKIGPHRDALRSSMAKITGLDRSRISVKATTSERLGFTGRSEGIAAMASATVRLPFSDTPSPA